MYKYYSGMDFDDSYVSFLTAVRLKEAGFPQNIFCPKYYNSSQLQQWTIVKNHACSIWTTDDMICQCPTLAVAAKWIKQCKEIRIVPKREFDWNEIDEKYENPKYVVDFYRTNDMILGRYMKPVPEGRQCNPKPYCYETYEEALEAGINYILDKY